MSRGKCYWACRLLVAVFKAQITPDVVEGVVIDMHGVCVWVIVGASAAHEGVVVVADVHARWTC